MNRSFHAIIFIILFSCSERFEQQLKYDAPALTFKQKVDSIVMSKMNDYNIPGLSVGLIKDDSIIYNKGYGVRSIENKLPVTENSIFHTASISKLFTALAVMKLVDEGQLSLEDKLVSILPEMKLTDQRIKDITIKQLLNHTAGVPDISNYEWENNNQSDMALESYILGLDITLDFDPSTDYNYSNLGYDILGHVVQEVSHVSFEDYVKESFFEPNGINQSDFRYYEVPESLRVSPHTKNLIGRHIEVRDTYPYTREHAPSSTLNASSADLSRWMIGFLQLIDDEKSGATYRSMLEPSFNSYPHIGLGFQIGSMNEYTRVGHFGGDQGFRSFLFMVPDAKIGLVLLANCDYNEDFRQEILNPIAELMLASFDKN